MFLSLTRDFATGECNHYGPGITRAIVILGFSPFIANQILIEESYARLIPTTQKFKRAMDSMGRPTDDFLTGPIAFGR